MEKLTITGYEKPGEDGTGESRVGDHQVLLNPATIQVGKKIHRNSEEQPHGKKDFSTLSSVAADTLSFELIYDNTGVVENAEPVPDKLRELEELVYDFQTETHQANFVEIKWGKFLFRGFLTSIQTNYNLFDSDGTALRAKVNLSFEGYIPPAKFERNPGAASPDLTHIRFATESDTLVNFCQEIYGSSRYVIQVARHNQLLNLRTLEPGQRLEFPPLINMDYV